MSSSLLSKMTQRCVAIALAAAAVTTIASAQAPLVPSSVLNHHHAKAAPPHPENVSAPVLSGASYVSMPRRGAAATRDPLQSFLRPLSSPSASPWTFTGPAGVVNAYGTVGGNLDTISGRVAGIAVDPTDNNTFYVAAAGGGVWKTTDGGGSYVPTTDFLGDTAMGSIAIAPSNHNIIYAGTGEANNSGDSQYGIGLLKSTDGAASWSLIPGPSSAFYRLAISKIVVSPTDANTVYLTTTDFAENGVGGNTGVWKTTDGGSNWTNTTAAAGLDSFQPYTDLVMDPTHPNTLYAAIGTLYGATANGVYKTTNGGTSWTKLGGGFPTASVGRIALALAPSAPGTIYASVSSASTYGLLGFYATTDSGATWTQKTAAPNYLGGQGWYDNAIAVSPTNSNQVFAGGQVNYGGSYGSFYALAGSQDGGATFQDYSIGTGYVGPHTDLHALTFTADGTALLDGNDGGVWRLENPSAAGGVSTTQWSDLNANLGTLQFTGIALHPTDPMIAYGGSQDNGTEKYTGSIAWSAVRGGDGGFVRVDQSNPQTVYHEYYGISLERSDDGGSTWNGTTTGINPSDPQPADGSDPAAFYVPFKLDPANQARVIYGTDHIYESTNHGDNFSAIGTPGTAGYNPNDYVISTLGVYGNTIYAAAQGSIFATFNDGGSWTDVSIPGYGGHYSDIYVDPSNTSNVYVSRSGFGGGKIFHSTDGGANWSDITSNLPDEPFNAIVQNPATGTLYAGGDDGVYSSADGGASWARLDPAGNFPNVQVVDLALSPGANLIGAGTHGRGLFEMTLSPPPSLLSGLALSPTSIYGGAPTYGKVTLSSAAPAGGETVSLTSSSGSVTLPAAVTVPAGAASATFAMTTAAVTTDTPVTITATDGSATENATLTLLTKYNITGNLTKAGAPLSGASVTASATGSFLLTKNLATVQAIPDNDPTGITQTITVPDVGTITDLKLGLNLTHSYIADLVVTLTGPDGTSVVVHNRTGGSADDIVTSYPVLTTPDASLSAFNGKPTNGTWTLKVQDLDTADTGSLNAWDLTFTYNGAVTKTAATDSAGNYSLTGLKPATYSVVPAASGLTFSPTSRVVTLGPSRSGVNFTGYPAPTLSSFTPTSGPVGAAVTLTGTGFTGATSVKFHGTAASFTVSSDTQITATVPSGATTGTISVTTPGGTATSTGSFAVTVPPTITSFTPTSARVGKTVSLTGTGFTGATSVKFHGTAATTYTVNSDTKITATVPTGATTGTISVTTPLGTATSSAVFTVTVSAPVITSFTPTSGPAGTSVTLTGSNFTGASAVAFHGTSASFTVTSSTKITATVPTGATSGTISVTTAGGTATSSASFTVIPPPVLSSLSPTSAYAGGGSLSLSVTGANFVSGAVVHFGTTALATTFVSTTQLTATITSALRANVATFNVTVLNPDSQTSGGQPFVVKPRLTALTLAATRVSGGQSVTATVTLNGPAPTGGIAIALTSSDTARATVPASVTVPANATSATFAVTTLAVTSTGVTNIGASGAGGTFSAPLTTLAPLLTTADTFGQDGSSANTNFGTVNPLLVKTSTGTGSNRDTYLKFSLSGVTSITSARLVLTASLSGSGSQTSGVFGTSSGWTEGGLTWNTRPALGSSLGSVTVSGTSAAVYSVDVTSYVQSQVSGGVASFGLHNPSVSTLVTRIVSRELGTGAAQLILNGN